MKMNERTLQMKQNYMRLHEQGLSPNEIADLYKLDVSTVYRYLGEIAEANGVSRASLLERPHGEHVCYERQFAPVEPVDLTEFRGHFDASIQEIDGVRLVMKTEIKRQERIAEGMQKEEESWAK